MAVWALMQIALVDISAVVADSVGNIECKVVTSLLSSHLQQVQVLLLRQVLVQIHVQGGATCEVLDIRSAMQLKLINDGKRFILNNIEIGVIAVARHKITVLTILLGMLHTDILGRNHLAVEHHIL